ncbi:hypothetical protein DUI87_20538 [Hirundo rustica rustica]|uniref:RNA-directed DNA polymerase n=1 Tax=Hirundo rustica rustica TaxID=333673 RepID=A0A3M0JQP1_HIRRU|nr:hypothetical protein DUI87_20538 [Hirundo rustica rustica]
MLMNATSAMPLPPPQEIMATKQPLLPSAPQQPITSFILPQPGSATLQPYPMPIPPQLLSPPPLGATHNTYQPLAWQALTELHDAVGKYGLGSAKVMQVLRYFNASLLTPFDIRSLARALFPPVEYDFFENKWTQLAVRAVERNRTLGQGDPRRMVNTDMLMRTGNYTRADGQAGFELLVQEQCQQTGIAALVQTLQLATPQQTFATIVQGIDEPFLCFAGWLTAAAEKQVRDPAARKLMLHSLAQSNCNALCKRIIETLPWEPLMSDMVGACAKEPFNLITDSAYVADIAQRLSCSVLKEVSNPALFHLLKALWCAIQARVHPYYVLHVRSHTNLPGFVVEGNARADKLANPAWVAPQPDVLAQAKASHGFFHQNTHTLQKQFHLTATEAREIVESCDDCHALGAPLLAGVNPRGLKALELWQTDVTQVAEFGRLKYVHVTVDTFSSAMWASAHTGEKAHDVIAHWRQAFAVLGISSAVKTDNGPAYASQQASDGDQQPRAKVRVRNLVTKQWEGSYDLIAMGRGYACVSTDTGTRWLPSKCVRPDLRPQRQNSADRQGGSRDQLESHQVDESLSDHSDDSSTDSD